MKLSAILSKPKVYRVLFVSGFLVFGIGAILESIILLTLAVVVVATSKYGMRKEHKEKLKLNDEIYPAGKERTKL